MSDEKLHGLEILAVLMALAALLLLAGCAAPVVHKTAPVSPPSVTPVRADIAKAKDAGDKADAKALLILDWLESHP